MKLITLFMRHVSIAETVHQERPVITLDNGSRTAPLEVIQKKHQVKAAYRASSELVDPPRRFKVR
jgi:hypothetical protein